MLDTYGKESKHDKNPVRANDLALSAQGCEVLKANNCLRASLEDRGLRWNPEEGKYSIGLEIYFLLE